MHVLPCMCMYKDEDKNWVPGGHLEGPLTSSLFFKSESQYLFYLYTNPSYLLFLL